MKKFCWIPFLAAAALAANSVATTDIPFDARPQPPTEYEFYWDDGILAGGWFWFTGGNYWAVDFSEKTGGEEGWLTRYGAVTIPDWPDSTYQGCYMHTFSDGDHDTTFLQFTTGGVYEWVAPEEPVYVPSGDLFVAFQQIGNYPACDSMGVDAVAGSHNWTGYQGSWAPTTLFGDFMIRCYWDDEEPGSVTDTTWGRVKALY
jgi:hypothetical protein